MVQKFVRNGQIWRKSSQRYFGLTIPFTHGRVLVTFLRDAYELEKNSGICIDCFSFYFETKFIDIFIFRQIGELCAQYRQLTRLLTPNERSGLGTDTLMRFFDDVKGIFKLFIIHYFKVTRLFIHVSINQLFN